MSERPFAFYPRLSRFTVADVLKERGKDLSALIVFGNFVIMWDAPSRNADRDRKTA